MALTSKTSDFQSKKEKKKRKNFGKSTSKQSEKITSVAEAETKKPATFSPYMSSAPVFGPPSNPLNTPDPAFKNLLIQKSKTLVDFRRKPKEDKSTDSIRTDQNQLSFRKRINHFIQNSPLLKRSNYLKHTASLKSDLNRLSDSLESLKIDENRILGNFPDFAVVSQPALANPRKLSKNSRSISGSSIFDSRKQSLGNRGLLSGTKIVCQMCAESNKTRTLVKSGSLLNLSDKTAAKLSSMKRSESLQLSVRPWTWILGATRQNSKDNIKAASDEFCMRCGLPMYLFQESCFVSSYEDSFRSEKIEQLEKAENGSESDIYAETNGSAEKARSRSLTHIDQIEQGQRTGIFFREMNSSEKGGEQLGIPAAVTSKHRRQMLSRSEASSSECFTVGIEGAGDNDGNDEFVQASKDTILRDALLDICKKRGIDLSSSNVFLDANKSPLPCLDIDTSWMGGKHIRIKVNDRVTALKKDQKNSFAPPMKKKSGNYKGVRSGSRTHNVSSEETSAMEPGPSGRSKRWSGFFGTSRDTNKMETLIDLLDSYTKNGVYEYKEDIYKLEPDWKPIVSNSGNLEEKQSQQQEAIWELLRSEIDYIKMLRVVSHLFIACLVNLQSNQLLLEIDNNKLFGNVEEIYSCNDMFWKKHLMPLVEHSRKTGEPLNPDLLKDGFMDFSVSFKCYETYCSQQSRCQSYCREKLQQEQDNELFTAYLAWCETQKECNRLKLLDILVKPMQRLTKYSLLLKAIMKHTVNASQKNNLTDMIKSVDSFVNNVNSTLKQNQDLETMKQLMSKIESYDVIESKDDDLANLIQKYSTLNLTYDIPGTTHKRSLLFESDVKYKDVTTSSKIEVHAFLFTDLLLITKPVKRLGESKVKFKIIRQPFVVDYLVTQEINRDPPSLACVYLSVYKTACTAFMLSCSESELVRSWSEAIKRAKNLCSSLKTLQGTSGQIIQTVPPISRQPSGFANEDVAISDNMEEGKTMTYNLGLWASRSPRGSSYGSRISSLVHSHSGSMEMTENISSMSSVSASRGVSVENNSEVRGSSLSSDDGTTNVISSPRVELTTSPKIELKDTSSALEKRESPILLRPESKSLYRKSITKTKNTLTIQVPHLGQSLPNLNIASSTSSGGSSPNPCPPNSLLLAPPKSHGGLLSPSQRGVSYPPPSPPRGSLKRGFAISPKNPPLQKTGNVLMELSRSVSVTQSSIMEPEKQIEDKAKATMPEDFYKKTPTYEKVGTNGKFEEGKCSQCNCNSRTVAAKSNGKKLVRSDKKLCSGVTIEDPKFKHDSSSTSRKQQDFESLSESFETGLSVLNKHLSITSAQSSSGFSSAGSSVESSFAVEEGSSDARWRVTKFQETFRMMNFENGEGNSVTRINSEDLKWRKESSNKIDQREEAKSATDTFGSRSNGLGITLTNEFLNKTQKFERTSSKLLLPPHKKSSDGTTTSMMALNLENIFRLHRTRQMKAAKDQKRKRRTTL